MDAETMQKMCALWQEILRLRDWLVVVREVGHDDLPPGVLGLTEASLERKEAVICLLRESERPERDPLLASSLEESLVHELLHLHFEAFWDEDHKVQMEQTIQVLARALVRVASDTPGGQE